MSRLSTLLFLAATACGGSPKQPPLAPLPDDKPAEPVPTAAVKPATPDPAPPPQAAGPAEVVLPATKTTVKLVAAGKGKRAPLRYTNKAGDKQSVEVAMDFAAKETHTGKSPADQIVPTIVLGGSAEVTSVDKDGNAAYVLTVSSTDVRANESKINLDQFKTVISSLAGLVITSTLAPSGAAGDVSLKIEKPGEMTAGALELVKMTLPQFPVLPTEPIAVGAKWQATTSLKLAEKLDITQVTDYELIAHKGATWTIKGTTKVSGTDQDVGEGAKISAIKGTGTSETTLADGVLYPTTKSSLETQFTASDPKEGAVQFAIKVGGAVTPAKK